MVRQAHDSDPAERSHRPLPRQGTRPRLLADGTPVLFSAGVLTAPVLRHIRSCCWPASAVTAAATATIASATACASDRLRHARELRTGSPLVAGLLFSSLVSLTRAHRSPAARSLLDTPATSEDQILGASRESPSTGDRPRTTGRSRTRRVHDGTRPR